MCVPPPPPLSSPPLRPPKQKKEKTGEKTAPPQPASLGPLVTAPHPRLDEADRETQDAREDREPLTTPRSPPLHRRSSALAAREPSQRRPSLTPEKPALVDASLTPERLVPARRTRRHDPHVLYYTYGQHTGEHHA